MIANILSIAGSDPSGGAGIQADIKAISAQGCYAMAVVTALTAQNTIGVVAAQAVDPSMVRAQLAAIRADIRIDAIKVGMLFDRTTIETVSEFLGEVDCPVVVDPVMVAKGGSRLLREDAVVALRERLLPRATLLTPNLPEAADLLGIAAAEGLEAMRDQGRDLVSLGCGAVLMKGGHLPSRHATDLLVSPVSQEAFDAARIATRNTHGTGCTLSSALAARLGAGDSVRDAVVAAKAYVTAAITQADSLSVGHGHGPVQHFPAGANGR